MWDGRSCLAHEHHVLGLDRHNLSDPTRGDPYFIFLWGKGVANEIPKWALGMGFINFVFKDCVLKEHSGSGRNQLVPRVFHASPPKGLGNPWMARINWLNERSISQRTTTNMLGRFLIPSNTHGTLRSMTPLVFRTPCCEFHEGSANSGMA